PHAPANVSGRTRGWGGTGRVPPHTQVPRYMDRNTSPSLTSTLISVRPSFAGPFLSEPSAAPMTEPCAGHVMVSPSGAGSWAPLWGHAASKPVLVPSSGCTRMTPFAATPPPTGTSETLASDWLTSSLFPSDMPLSLPSLSPESLPLPPQAARTDTAET